MLQEIKKYKPESREVEYQIPASDYSLQRYNFMLWGGELEQKGFSIRQIFTYLNQEVIPQIAQRDGYVLDIGAGRSKAMSELNERILEIGSHPKGVCVDLKSVNSPLSVIGDAFNLPFKEQTFQLIVSHELLPYLLEDRDGEDFKKFLSIRKKSREVVEAESLKRCDPNNSKIGQLLFDLKKELNSFAGFPLL